MIPYTLKLYNFLLKFRSLSRKNLASTWKCVESIYILAAFWQNTYILGNLNDIKSNIEDSGISLKEGANVRL